MARKQAKAATSPGCEELCKVDARDLIKWVAGIDRKTWPDWEKSASRPAVVANGSWERMDKVVAPVVAGIMKKFPEHRAGEPMLTTVHPGDFVPLHADTIHPGWVTRIHVPIVTNKDAVMIVGDREFHMDVGKAYEFDVSRPHAIRNDGKTSRIHLMFDVFK